MLALAPHRCVALKPDLIGKIPPVTRRSAPEFDDDAAASYARAVDALERDGVPYLVGGALGLNAHTGVWRDTKDLDLFVRPGDASIALQTLADAGFISERVYESWLGKAWMGDVFVDIIWRNANGLFPVTSAWFDHPAKVHAFGRDMPCLPLEELLLSKMMVMGRYRFDGADILHVLAASGGQVDWDRLADLAGEHVALMLAHLHAFRWAYPAWRENVPDAVIERFGALARDASNSFGPFRGRLLDLPSYEVDVEAWGLPDAHRIVLERIFGDAEGRT